MILLWDSSALRQTAVLRQAGKIVVIDPSFFRDVEASSIAGLAYSLLGPAGRTKLRDASRQRYGELLGRFAGINDAYVFFTGPSMKDGLEKPMIKESVRLVCNSIVRDDAVVEKIHPDAILFLDPAYHFGVSRYASEFRAQVARVLSKLPSALCIVPEHYAPLLKGELAASAADRVIGMPVVAGVRVGTRRGMPARRVRDEWDGDDPRGPNGVCAHAGHCLRGRAGHHGDGGA
jgi:hypothetical protein